MASEYKKARMEDLIQANRLLVAENEESSGKLRALRIHLAKLKHLGRDSIEIKELEAML